MMCINGALAHPLAQIDTRFTDTLSFLHKVKRLEDTTNCTSEEARVLLNITKISERLEQMH